MLLLQEVCVGILGNIACFPDTCLTLSQNEDLGCVEVIVCNMCNIFWSPLFYFNECNSLCVQCCAVASAWRCRSANPSGNLPVCIFHCADTWERKTEREIFIFCDDVCRLLLTCVSQKDVCSLWLRRIRQRTSVRSNLFFIMRSSTNSTMLYSKLLNKLITCYLRKYQFDIPRWLTLSQSPCKLFIWKAPCGVSDL